METRPAYLWDYELSEEEFRALLAGELVKGRLDRDWAVVRLLNHAPYPEIVRLLGFPALLQGWPRWCGRVRSESRRRGLDFLVEWLPKYHPELV